MKRTTDLFTVWSFLRRNFRVFAVLTLAISITIVYFTKPPRISGEIFQRSYQSSGSLLLAGPSRVILNEITAINNRNELQNWLAEPEIFAQFLEHYKYYERLAEKLRKGRPHLAGLAKSVIITPVYAIDADAQIRGRDKFEHGDYAHTDEVKHRQRGYLRRATRLTFLATAGTPSDSQWLVSSALQLLQEILTEVATARVRSKKRAIQRYLRVAEAKLRRGQAEIQNIEHYNPENYERNHYQFELVRTQHSKVTRDLEEVANKLAMGASSGIITGYEGLLSERSRDLINAHQVYLPDSLSYQMVRAQLGMVRTFDQRLRLQRWNDVKADLEMKSVKLQRKKVILDESLRQLGALLVSSRQRSQFSLKQKQVMSWETEVLSWEYQLLRVRLEERLCENDGSTIVLQEPLPGHLIAQPVEQFFTLYKKMFSMLPLAPLVALTIVVGFQAYGAAKNLRRSVEFYFDAPVLAELPSARRGQTRERAKRPE